MNTDKLLELESLATDMDNFGHDLYQGGQALSDFADRARTIAAALRAEQAVGYEQRARESGMLPDDLVPHAKEWYRLCERRFTVDKMTISGQLAEAIVDAICALGTARQSEGVVPCEWNQQDRGSDWISTGCGNEFVLTDASDYDDGAQVFKHCPYCAAPAIFSKWKTDSETMLAAAPGGEGEG